MLGTVFFALATVGLDGPASASAVPARIDSFGVDVTYSNRSITVIETVFDYGNAGSTTVLRKVRVVTVPYRTMVLVARRAPQVLEAG
ncbi:hypothetical protein G3I65_50195 [Amycolatopsis sp. SID8362]|nr:hypothetical protein [Amycolatopsis sp. SID8362]